MAEKEQKPGQTLVCLGILGGIALVSLLWIFFMPEKESGNLATITLGGEVVQVIDLSRVDSPYELVLEGTGRYHKIGVVLGEVAVLEANCMDQICVKQGYRNSSAIICLPHQMMISFSGEEGALDYDVITG